MAQKKRVEYVQEVGADWQLPTTAGSMAAISLVLFMLLSQLNNAPSSPAEVSSPSDRYGQIRRSEPNLQPNVGTDQQGSNPVQNNGGLQQASSAEAFYQFDEGGQ